jgi:hypothetical protein
MRRLFLIMLVSAVVFLGASRSAVAASCAGSGSFLSLPSWYQYLDCEGSTPTMTADRFMPNMLLIGLAIIELLIRLSGIIATGYVIWGGIKYITSQGSSDGVKSARDTLTQALVGLVIVIIATTLVSTVARIVSSGYN